MGRKNLDSPRVAPRAGESLVDRIRDKGLRLTEQRRVLAELLDRAEQHLDAEAVYKLAREKDPSIHRATVYARIKSGKQKPVKDGRRSFLTLKELERYAAESNPSEIISATG